ncbi:Hypothetical_protein [Hexamita inflata]|uniref:Hypothetical_protein n=1 Tax=Hexamita inflata TaxID=28002 RepID=A0AA86TVP9_9EUKA|nr:Hypothetical protein HINF_LOCUS18375 [Hexamita inflata]
MLFARPAKPPMAMPTCFPSPVWTRFRVKFSTDTLRPLMLVAWATMPPMTRLFWLPWREMVTFFTSTRQSSISPQLRSPAAKIFSLYSGSQDLQPMVTLTTVRFTKMWVSVPQAGPKMAQWDWFTAAVSSVEVRMGSVMFTFEMVWFWPLKVPLKIWILQGTSVKSRSLSRMNTWVSTCLVMFRKSAVVFILYVSTSSKD